MSKKNQNKCSFCGKPKEEVKILIAGLDGHICENCVAQAKTILDEEFFSHKSTNKSSQLKIQKRARQKPKELQKPYGRCQKKGVMQT